MRNCDIIIPVFNAYEYLVKCLNSVSLNTNLTDNRLIIIDDKSTDERIIPFIEDFTAHEKQNIICIKNINNQGFIKTVNIGMKFSNNDVVLLNSDTEVTKNWLDKMQKCAYSKEKIATVTPLSNNGTIASIPLFCKENELPRGYDLSEYQTLIDRISYEEYPEIPTGVGFCLYIKRSSLDEVGFFNEVLFGKAYGEEEDFCYRCLEHGYINILCDNVVVFHKASQSLNNYYQNIFKEREITLLKEHPIYKSNTARWVTNAPLIYINKNINYNICLNNGKSNILLLVHIWEKEISNTIGGTSLHILDIINMLKENYNFHVFSPHNDAYCLHSYWADGEETTDLFSSVFQCHTNRFFNSEYAGILNDIIISFKIDIIHVHHMSGHYFDLIDILKNKKIKLIISLHDLYSICPRINKINSNNMYCGYPAPNENECISCLDSLKNSFCHIEETQNIKPWRDVWKMLFSLSSNIIVPSEETKLEITDIYRNFAIDVIEHGTNLTRSNIELNIDTDTIYNVAFIGGISVIKGKTILENLINYANNNNDKIYFHLFGDIDSNITHKKYKKFYHHGSYERKDLNILFSKNNIKLVCILSIWPETFCYTFVESICNNIPVLAIDIGVIGRKIRENNLGWLIKDTAEISEIYKIIKNIFADKNGYKTVSKSVSEYKIRTIEEMGCDYDKIYSSYKAGWNNDDYIEKLKIFIKDNYIGNVINDILDKSLQKHKEEVDNLLNSKSWRYTKPLRSLASFFKCINGVFKKK